MSSRYLGTILAETVIGHPVIVRPIGEPEVAHGLVLQVAGVSGDGKEEHVAVGVILGLDGALELLESLPGLIDQAMTNAERGKAQEN